MNIAAITVTYHPDLLLLEQQLNQLKECLWIIVDNGSQIDEIKHIEKLVQSRNNCILIKNNSNQGLAKALNTGVDYVKLNSESIEFVLLLDQDSAFDSTEIKILESNFLELERQNKRVGCIGPKLVDFKTKQQHGFHRMRCGLWQKIYPSSEESKPIACTNINGSGTFMRLAVFCELNGLSEELFIDHLDTEWSFRLIAAGYSLYGIPQAVFDHRMGEDSFRFWLFGWRVWPLRSPLRHYYLFRNTIKLLRLSYIPLTWKFWALMKMQITLLVYGVFNQYRKEQIKMMLKGIRDGAML